MSLTLMLKCRDDEPEAVAERPPLVCLVLQRDVVTVCVDRGYVLKSIPTRQVLQKCNKYQHFNIIRNKLHKNK
jgi:hypothetical protein